MTKVRFRVNLGIRDAGSLGLKYQECTSGAEVSVDSEVATVLESRGFAEVIGPPEIEAVPEQPAIAKAKKPKTVKRLVEEMDEATPDEFKSE